MGWLAILRGFTRAMRNGAQVSDVVVDSGGGPNVTAEHFATAGDDAHPLTTDYVALTRDSGTGRATAVGYLDPINVPIALAGDKRIYGRDASSGAAVVDVWLKNDSTAIVSNANGSVTLQPDGGTIVNAPGVTLTVAADGSISGGNGSGSFVLTSGGDFVVNGVTIDTSGNISTPASVSAPSILAAGNQLAGHVHLAGTPPGNTGPNI